MPNMFKVQAAPLLYTSKQIRFQRSACVCFCNMPESEKVWTTGRLAVGHCTASHCIGLYKEITLK